MRDEARRRANREYMRRIRASADKPQYSGPHAAWNRRMDARALEVWAKYEDPKYYSSIRVSPGNTRYWEEM